MSRIDGGSRWFVRQRLLTGYARAAVVAAASFASTSGIDGSACAQIPCQYSVTATIQAPPGPFGLPSPTIGTAISPNGRYVVGYFNPGAIGFDRAFAYDVQTQQFHVIPLPPGNVGSYAHDVNDAGLAVGTYGGEASGDKGFIYSIPQQQYLHVLASEVFGGQCVITGINSSNTVCGWRSITGPPTSLRTAFRWNAASGIQDLGLIESQSSSAAGIAEDGAIAVIRGGGTHSYLWSRREMTNIGVPTHADGITAQSIGNGGRVLASALFLPSGEIYSNPYEFAQGRLRELPSLAAANATSVPSDINSSGLIVGSYSLTAGELNWRACAWHGEQVVDLTSRLLPGSGFVLGNGTAVSDTNRIVIATQTITFVIDPLPDVTGDTNCDRLVNVTDLLAVISQWDTAGSGADLNHDGIVDVFDLVVVILNWHVN